MVLRNFNELICMQFTQHVHMLIVSTVAKVYMTYLWAICILSLSPYQYQCQYNCKTHPRFHVLEDFFS